MCRASDPPRGVVGRDLARVDECGELHRADYLGRGDGPGSSSERAARDDLVGNEFAAI